MTGHQPAEAAPRSRRWGAAAAALAMAVTVTGVAAAIGLGQGAAGLRPRLGGGAVDRRLRSHHRRQPAGGRGCLPQWLTVSALPTASTWSTTALPARRLYWRARAHDAAGNPGAWSALRSLEIR